VFLIPPVDAELLLPCEVPTRDAQTLKDVGIILTDHVEALDCANGKIAAIDKTLTDFSEQALP
jgi:hypothetical protein